jgi:hypothetical protein
MKPKTLLKRVARSKKQLPHRLRFKRKLIVCLAEAVAAGTLQEALADQPKLTKWLRAIKAKTEALSRAGHLWQEEQQVDTELLSLLSGRV